MPAALAPPVTSTLPEGNSVAVCLKRAVARGSVGLQVPVAGSYTSALARKPPWPVGSGPRPPVTSTLPEGNSVAVWLLRAVASAPVGLQVPVAGSYTSTLARGPAPPATSTLPERNSVAVWLSRPVVRAPVGLQVPVAWSAWGSLLSRRRALSPP